MAEEHASNNHQEFLVEIYRYRCCTGSKQTTYDNKLAMSTDRQTNHNQSPSLTVEQLIDIRDRLKQPLHDQPVMIPLGSQAFVPGTLASFEDTVTITVNGSRRKVSRAEAIETIQNEIDAGRPKPKQAPTKPKPAAASATQATPAPKAVPQFYEIREQIDDHGNEIKGEAIGVTKQLELVYPTDADDVSTEMEVEDMMVTKPLKPVSDQEYAALVTRMDELARLEEQDAANRKDNQASSKKIQSKGWSKGFLNARASKKTQPKQIDSCNETADLERLKTRKVQFGADTVEEIPKIGHSLPVPSRPLSRPIEPTLFSNVVEEHKHSSRERKLSSPKKLSRFAMERQQGLR